MNEKKVRRLIKSAVDISTNVLRAFCQKRLLSCPEEDFQSFLTENLHYFFHQYEENIRCCECTLSDCNNIKTIDLPKSVFLQAYAFIGDPSDGHVVIEKERIVQKCIHTYVTHDISLDDLETEALSVFLYHRGNLSPEEYRAVKVIQTVVQRLDDMKREQPRNIEIKLADLETAVISLTYPHYYRKIVTELFAEICKLDKSKQEESGIKKGKMLSQTKECSINMEKWINDKENISLRSKSNEQNMQMLTNVLNSLIPTERHNQSPLENVAEMDKILTESCPIEKQFGKLKIHVQYQKIVKNDKTNPNFELRSPIDVKWNFKTPKGWKIEKIIKKLKSKMDEISTNLPLRIKNVTGGSVNILTTVEANVLVDQTQCNRVVKSFLGKIVSAGGFVTNRRNTINVCAEIVHEDPTLSLSMSETSVRVPLNVAETTKFAFEFGTNARENYPGIFMCDGFIVDCIVDGRLENRPSSHWKYDQNMYDVCKITNPFKRFLHQHQSVQKKSFTHKSMYEWFTNSIRLQEPGTLDINPGLDCRYFLSHFYQNNDDFKVLHFFLKLAIDNQSYNCAKPLAWQLTRLFVKSFKKKQFHDVWPGFICVCKDKLKPVGDYKICSSDIVIVAEVYAVEDVFPRPRAFHGIPITYKVVKGYSPEANLISKEIDQYQNVEDNSCAVNVSNEQARQFFSAHSKLCLITKSSLRSKGYNTKKKKQTFVKEPCIQLFCRFKGVIPVGEKHFPTTIDSIATDVLEGYPQLLVKDVKIGSEVGSSCRAGTGTLGGFVKYLGEDALLTCAHVVLERDLLGPNAKRSEMHEKPIVVYCRNPDEQEFKCGKLVSYVFPPELSEGTSVDAAIISMDPFSRISENVVAVDSEGHYLKSMYLHRNYIDYREIGTIHEVQVTAVGAISSVQQGSDRICLEDKKQVEFETLAHAVRNKVNHYPTPLEINDCIHLVDHAIKQVGDEELKTPRTVTLHQQISMRNVSFTQGDSGMCIYVKCTDNEFRCVGMAIASHPDGGCIITPIKAILSAFKLI